MRTGLWRRRARLSWGGILLAVLLALWLGRSPAVDEGASSQAKQQGVVLRTSHELPSALLDALTLARQEVGFRAAVQRKAVATLHQNFWLHGIDTQLYTAWNAPVTLKAINWYGFEYAPFVPDGLNRLPLDAILAGVRRLGFNALRLTFADETVQSNPIVTAGLDANPAFRGLHSLDIMQRIIERAHHFGLRVILCNSRSEAGRGPEIQSGTWFTAEYPESVWMADWRTLVTRFRGDSAFVGADLRNEPHVVSTGAADGNPYLDDGPMWGAYGGVYHRDLDWHYAAQTLGNELLAINPHLLIIVEGVQTYIDPQTNVMTSALWGSNLIGVQYDQVQLSHPGQLVYSVHEYGPQMWQATWFTPQTTYASLAKRWNAFWGYLLTAPKFMRAPIFVGEFGTCHEYHSCISSPEGWKEGFWFGSFVRYLHAHPQIGWAYWALNPTGPAAATAVDDYSLVTPDWRHYYPLVVRGLASLLSEPDGLGPMQSVPYRVSGASTPTFTPRPGCSPTTSCVAGGEAANPQPALARSLQVTPNVPYVRPADPIRVGDLYVPRAGRAATALRPAAIVLHGGSWSQGSRNAATAALARDLARHGYVAFDINYRLTDGGGAFPHDIQDVKDAIAYLITNAARLRIDPARIGLVGAGVGGYLATMAAYTPDTPQFSAPHYPRVRVRVAAVASFFAPTDLAQLALKGKDAAELQNLQAYIGAGYAQLPDRYRRASPATYLPGAVPTIFFHGLADPDAPFGRTFRLYRNLREWSIEAQLIDFPGAPHGLAALQSHTRQVALLQLESFFDGVFQRNTR